MENRFYNRDFEDFVKRNADQYRMFPSEKVWTNIHNNLHTRRRWYAIGITLLLLTMGTVTGVMVSNSSKKSVLVADSFIPVKKNSAETKNTASLVITKKPERKKIQETRFISTVENLQKNIFLNNRVSTDNTNDNTSGLSPETGSLAGSAEEPVILPAHSFVQTTEPELLSKNNSNNHRPLPAVKQNPVTVNAIIVNNNTPVVSSGQADELFAASPAPVAENKQPSAVSADAYPLTIESVVNAYHLRHSRKRLSWEVFFTPTVTYRSLSENKDFIASAQTRNNSLSYTAFADINSLVTHKPDMGLQLGVTAGYPLFKNINLTGGLQFNVSKYDIKAYYSQSEVATIALNTTTGANSVSTSTNYRNFSGSNVNWLRNLYLSASVPIGLEWKFAGKNNTGFGVRGTVQPTFILGNQAYLLSTDYKNYAEVPSLIRKFNVNTGVELFATYSTGRIKWKIGPQARLQMKSSFKGKYPVIERLYDFGLKVGIMLK